MDFILSFNNNEVVMTFPVIPSGGISLEVTQANQSFDSINGEMQALGKVNLATFTIESFFPLKPYPFIRPGGDINGWFYVSNIKAAMARRIPFRAIYLDQWHHEIFNMPVSVDSFEYGLDRAGDIAYKLSFREYRFASTAIVGSLPAQTDAPGAYESETAASLTVAQTAAQAAAASGGTYPRLYSAEEANIMAKLLYGEAGGVSSTREKACVCWTVCNRVDAGYGSLAGVMTQKAQFQGYKASNPIVGSLKDLCVDVLDRWSREHAGESNVGRVLPKEYLWFLGDGTHNYFYKSYPNGKLNGATKWDYSLPNPYDS